MIYNHPQVRPISAKCSGSCSALACTHIEPKGRVHGEAWRTFLQRLHLVDQKTGERRRQQFSGSYTYVVLRYRDDLTCVPQSVPSLYLEKSRLLSKDVKLDMIEQSMLTSSMVRHSSRCRSIIICFVGRLTFSPSKQNSSGLSQTTQACGGIEKGSTFFFPFYLYSLTTTVQGFTLPSETASIELNLIRAFSQSSLDMFHSFVTQEH